ncbi:MAG: hypothetical protein AAGA75_09835 [Cyanobacteria bacterium P01_E01_bin.6]
MFRNDDAESQLVGRSLRIKIVGIFLEQIKPFCDCESYYVAIAVKLPASSRDFVFDSVWFMQRDF